MSDDVSDGAKQVLVVEDDLSNRQLLRQVLEDDGFGVTEAVDGPAALRALSQQRTDAVVLDLGLPGVDGVEVLRRVRARSGVPILVLSGRTQQAEKLAVLDAGADDYVVKPYSPPELAARVRALLRRGSPVVPPETLECRDLHIDLRARTARVAGQPIELTPKEYDLLAFLAASPGRTFTREELLEHVWGSTNQWQNVATVTEHVRRVRLKVEREPGGTPYIETVRGVGYRFCSA